MKRRILPAIIAVLFILVYGMAYCDTVMQKTPKDCVFSYYDALNMKKYKSAFDMKTQKAKSNTNFATWKKNWSNNVVVMVRDLKVESNNGKTAVVKLYLKSADTNLSNGKRFLTKYNATATLKKYKSAWWIDSIKVKTVAGSKRELLPDTAERMIVRGAKAEAFPKDIPLYPGFTMSKPVVVEEETGRGKIKKRNVIYSKNRVKKLSVSDVSAFYEKKMKKKGWKISGPAGGGTCLGLFLEKGDRRISISVFRTVYPATDSMSDPRGTCLQIFYWEE